MSKLKNFTNPMTKHSTISSDKNNKNKETEQQKQHIDITCGDVQRLKRRLESPIPDNNNLDCLLVADTTKNCAPIHLCTILVHYDCAELTQAELLFLLLYTIALESAYLCEEKYEKSERYIERVPSATTYHSKNVRRLSRLKPFYNMSSDKTRFSMRLISLIDSKPLAMEQLFSLMSASVSGDLMIVTLSPANSMAAEGFSIALSIGRYILTTRAVDKPIYYRFNKLNELTILLRNQLFVPMRNKQLQWIHENVYPSLDGMPVELYDHILQHLSKNELNCLANVNRSLRNLIRRSKYMKLREQQYLQLQEQQKEQADDNARLSRSNSALFYLR